MSLNEVVRELRKSKGWSQEVMAEKLDMSKNSYARLERGETQIKYDRLEQIANLFQIDTLKLVEAGYKGIVIQQTIGIVGLENHVENNDNHAEQRQPNDELDVKCEMLNSKVMYLKSILAEKDKRINELNDEIQILKDFVKVLQNK